MKFVIKVIAVALVVTGGWAFVGSGVAPAARFPYAKAGLTERQAAAHLISRFTFGARPGQVDTVVRMGLENWFAKQLVGLLPDDSLEERLSHYDALELSNEQVANTYPRNGQVVRMAIQDGVINKDSVKTDRKEYREMLQAYMAQRGLKQEQDLFRQLFCQKVLRAAYSENQLREVMTDFWFNHFNVSLTKNDCSPFIPAYERDVIRPNALGRFTELLLKTAKSPAMLYYLDNFQSSGPPKGLNENYAREVMELHTLGVDGGYTQQDVTEAARVLTGWGVYPMGQFARGGMARLAKFTDAQIAQRGFVHDGDFFFNSNRHDKGEKTVLGHVFPAGGGYEEGVTLLSLLAHQPATARFVCRKIAVRFVSDDPPASLVEKMAKTFLEKNGDIRQVLLTMVQSPEFWSPVALREKTKSPFELAIGAVRALNGDIRQPLPLFNWVARMGEKKYYYQAPTGFPDRGTYWINTGSLLNRMNFGLALAAGRVAGVQIDLLALNNGHEPESAMAALTIYGKILLPERDLAATEKRLTPLLTDPGLVQKVNAAAGDGFAMVQDRGMLAQAVGIIIGSPEFQRR
ncbi:MAG TPA: DUF1800 domain-containing protein [Puia sp.]|uniref:DUF1800 domain-containing protein n=1 Tax=Puia sp. TaxID=2045100 RepID=UPI002BF71A7D|nr:DUF1800 domain-containing protein [Puia sp.]HVU95199.1 DUF1800 domain-containing protein [Puia sp.]